MTFATRLLRSIVAHLQRHKEWYLVPASFLLLVGWRYREVWAGKTGVGWDVIESYWPDLSFLGNELRRGNVPLWNPYDRGGYPAHADPQAGLFSPLQGLFGLWASRNRAATWYLAEFKELFHHALAGMLLHLYLRTRKIPWPAALLGGVVLVLSGPWFFNSSNGYLYAIAWAPLVWVATDRVLEGPSLARGAALAGALYLPASAGSPPGYFYVLLTGAAYASFRGLSGIASHLAWRRRGPLPRNEGRALLMALGATVVLAAATQAIIFMPTRDLLAHSWRGSVGADVALNQSCAIVPTLASIVAPTTRAFGANLSLIAVILAALGVVAGPRRDGGAPLFFVGSAAVFLALSFGAKTPLLPWLVAHAPGFGLFRTACRYAVPYTTLLAVGVSHGFSLLFSHRPARVPIRLMPPLAVTVLVTLAIALVVRNVPDLSTSPPFARGTWLMAAACIVVLWLSHFARGRPAILLAVGLFALVYLDTTRFYGRDPAFQPRPDHWEDLAKIGHLPGLDGYRIFDDFLLEQRAGSRLSLREFRGYLITDPLAFADHSAIMGTSVVLPQLLGEYNVRYVFHGPHSIKGWGRNILSAPPDVLAPDYFRRLSPTTFEVLHPAPMVAWYGRVQILPHTDVLATLLRARDGSGVRRVAFVAAEDVTPELRASDGTLPGSGEHLPLPSISGKVTRFETELVDIEVVAPQAGVVVLNEAAYPGWKVFVDGREQSPLRVDLLLRGVLVESGHHQIRWIYRPVRWLVLLGVWAGGWLGIALVSFVSWKRRRHTHAAQGLADRLTAFPEVKPSLARWA